MPITINGSGTITGISAGGLPDGVIQPADLSTGGPSWDSSGNVTMSGRLAIPTQPMFSAGIPATSDASVASGAFVPFSSVSGSGGQNIGSHFNTSTYKFTAPVAGVYFFSTTIFFTNTASSTNLMQAALNINGTYFGVTSGDAMHVMQAIPNSAGGTICITGAWVVKLAANDVVGVSNRQSGVLRIYQGHCAFSGYLLG